MSSSVNTNAINLARQQYQTRSSLDLTTSLQKLSQGNRAGTTDDSAGITLSNALNHRIGPAYTVNLSTDSENSWAAKSRIRDTDFASETANLTRNQILVQSGISALTIANQHPQSLIALLR